MVENDSLVDIEKWYELLWELTFPTEFLEVSKEEAVKFKNYFNTREDFLLLVETRQSAMDAIKEELSPLAAKIQEKIDLYGGRAFIKTSSRSPKDAIELNGRLRQIYNRVKDTVPDLPFQLSDDPEDDNEQRKKLHDITHLCRGVMQASYEALMVTSGKEALDLLLNSQRICEDFTERIDYADKFCENIVIRKWVTFDWQMELRGFVYNNHLNGLSQYTHFMFLPKLYEQKDKVQEQILNFWESRCKAPLAHLKSYIIDFVLCDDGTIWVIELNPFDSLTNGTLYRWTHDLEELQQGPLKLRVRSDYYQRGLEIFSSSFPAYFPPEIIGDAFTKV